ncbi:MAG: hypothetical protein K9N55_19235 [Phycisphaerae bacterium]|nr:hypothetical protein [Phycisphaerae bacterium]
MTDSAFDDQSFLGHLPEDVCSDTGDATSGSAPETPPPQALNRFNDADMLSEIPEEEDPLYPEILQPRQKAPSLKRPFPWFIDIFLYPLNRSGLINLAVTFGVPLALILLTLGCVMIAKAMPLLIFVAVPLAMGSAIVGLLMVLYLGWYITECVRSSSEGQIRTPDTIGQTPGIMELFALCFQVCLCAMVFLGMKWSFHATFMPPAWMTHVLDAILAFMLPITLLSVISLESIRGLNPLLNLKLIGNTFLPYCSVAIPLYLAHRALFMVCLGTLPSGINIMILVLCEVYGAMVSAHVLGRFAWKQQDKLFWE